MLSIFQLIFSYKWHLKCHFFIPIPQQYMELDTLNAEIVEICQNLAAEAQTISQLQPVSHFSNRPIQFAGGVLGAIQEDRRRKRFVKHLDDIICKDWTFYSYIGHLVQTSEILVDKQLEVQKLTNETDDCYFSNVILIISSLQLAQKAWFGYSPDIASQDGYSKEFPWPLAEVIDYSLKEQFRRLHLPEGVSFPDEEEENKKVGFKAILIFVVVIIIFAILSVLF